MADTSAESRLVHNIEYPKIVYLESLIFYFGANFLYHHHIFRANQNRPQFAAFLLVNLFTSFQLAEATNLNVTSYYATIFNNSKEMQHRAALNQKLRLKLFGGNQY